MAGLNVYDILLFISLFFIVYPFLIYPIFLKLISLVNKQKINVNKEYQPEVTFVISAYNEEDYIAKTIDYIYKSDYPIEKIKILAGNDGSADKTLEILKKYESENPNFKVFDFPRSGKNAVINELMSKVDTEITLLLDADILLSPNTISNMIEKMSDEEVGAVLCKMYSSDKGDNVASYGESIYMKYEGFIQSNESIIFATVGTLGSLYGIKTECFRPVPGFQVADDMYIPFTVLSSHKRVFYDTDSVVYEYREKSLENELKRKIRISAAAFSTIWYMKELLSPKYPWVSFALISHKILRMKLPYFILLFLSLFIFAELSTTVWFIAFLIILVFGILAILGFVLEYFKINIGIVKFPMLFLTYAYAFFMGSIRFLSSKNNSLWSHNTNK